MALHFKVKDQATTTAVVQETTNETDEEKKKEEEAKRFKEYMLENRWVGFDLDGTLADNSGGWQGWDHIGKPIQPMIDRVKSFLEKGVKVKIFTARAGTATLKYHNLTFAQVEKLVQDWTEKHIGRRLPVTAEKDLAFIRGYDDSFVQAVLNQGTIVGDESTENAKKVFTKEEIMEGSVESLMSHQL